MGLYFTDSQISLLIEFLKTNSPSGFEYQMVKTLEKSIEPFCKIESDHIGNFYMYTGTKGGLRVMITAHSDEVGFQIVHIDKNGYAFIRSIATVDPQTIPGSRVIALSKKGEVLGVIGKSSPHVIDSKEREKVPHLCDMWVDFGFCSDKEAENYIEIGDYITLYSEPSITNNGKRIISKSLDNKISVFILAEVIRRLSNINTPLEIIGVATAQEELGSRGAYIAANRIKPDIAICLDVGIATDIPTMSIQNYGTFEMGKGVGIIRNANNNVVLTDVIINCAKKNNILYQKIIGHKPNGGTETSVIQMAKDGIATANISIPNRYMHSFVEMCDLKDVETAIELLFAVINDLKTYKKDDFNLFM